MYKFAVLVLELLDDFFAESWFSKKRFVIASGLGIEPNEVEAGS